jgi:hypothetical protein
MKTSIFVTTVKIVDPQNPELAIDLDIHKVDGGYVGISPDFSEEVANYIANPYEECQLVKLEDPQGNDNDLDPPLEEDELVGFLKILNAIDKTLSLLPVDQRDIMLDGIAKRAGLSRDRIEVSFGMAKETLDMAALREFTRVLQNEPNDK